ncbi:MAG: ankyrin repeat domain-containing protein [Thiolinea sp.]
MKTQHYYALWLVLLSLLLGPLSAQAANDNESLFYAAQAGQYENVKRLIERGANVNYYNQSRETPMHAAAAKGHVNIMQLLRSRGANPHVRTVGNWLPLHHAVRFGHVPAARYLIQQGQSPFARTRDGKNAFDIADATRNRVMINFLNQYRR